jgi:tetratricopeptide (TPR) repeat protein
MTALIPTLLLASPDLSRGVVAFEERKWSEARDAFLETLRYDPTNTEAHAYVNLIAREMEAERQAVVRAHRLQMLGAASHKLEEAQQDPGPLQQAILAAGRSERNAQENTWRSRCEEARMERTSGHLLAANDLILQVLAENGSFEDAQRELSELQSRIRRTLDSGESATVMERFALEGFYAYGQADFAAAANAWTKLRTLLDQSYPGAESARRAKDLHFNAYEKIALDHVNEEKRLAELKALFDAGTSLFQEKHFTRALEEFRKLAIRDPEYPQLGYYLVQAESAAEQERAQRLGEEKRQDIDRALQAGVAAMENEQLQDAEKNFEKVLKLDPSHPQARSYLAMVRAETQKRHDPKAAQMHYEAGLIAYASGKLDEAMREWHMAVRMNPGHEKALNALAKVQKELALNKRELTDETIP